MTDPEPFKMLPRHKALKPAKSNGCKHQKLTDRGIDYCLKNDKYLCRGLVEQGRCPK